MMLHVIFSWLRLGPASKQQITHLHTRMAGEAAAGEMNVY